MIKFFFLTNLPQVFLYKHKRTPALCRGSSPGVTSVLLSSHHRQRPLLWSLSGARAPLGV